MDLKLQGHNNEKNSKECVIKFLYFKKKVKLREDYTGLRETELLGFKLGIPASYSSATISL